MNREQIRAELTRGLALEEQVHTENVMIGRMRDLVARYPEAPTVGDALRRFVDDQPA